MTIHKPHAMNPQIQITLIPCLTSCHDPTKYVKDRIVQRDASCQIINNITKHTSFKVQENIEH